MPHFSIKLQKERHIFSAAHFITFNGNICERLHGHNYKVALELHGPLDENHYVVDFIAARDGLQTIINELDHRMLLPANHASIKVQTQATEVLVTFAQKRWIFPLEDCVILPIANTTAELLAQYIGERFLGLLRASHNYTPQQLVIQVDENDGQWGICQWQDAECLLGND
jgi:6-pyruvoyltetrahydropterin/6-carboxytetrahydropterin synthase